MAGARPSGGLERNDKKMKPRAGRIFVGLGARLIDDPLRLEGQLLMARNLRQLEGLARAGLLQ